MYQQDECQAAYLCGPITQAIMAGEDPSELFSNYEDDLTNRGYQVINPLEMDSQLENPCWAGDEGRYTPSWTLALRRDVSMIASKADVLAVMPGWEDSKGCKLEIFVAVSLGIPCIDAKTTEPMQFIANDGALTLIRR